MTQYMLSVHHREGEEPYANEDELQAAFKAVDAFNTKITEAGQWVFGGGLMPRETATVVDNTKGDATVTDGPFIEGKEWLGGFWVVELPDLDAALAMAQDASAACRGPVEVRPFQAE